MSVSVPEIKHLQTLFIEVTGSAATITDYHRHKGRSSGEQAFVMRMTGGSETSASLFLIGNI